MSSNHPEATIQMEIAQYLRIRQIPFFSVPNEAVGRLNSKRGMARITRLKAMGLLPGAPDLVVLYPHGTVTFVEVKGPKGRLSGNQREMRRIAEENGIRYCVVKSLADVVAALNIGD